MSTQQHYIHQESQSQWIYHVAGSQTFWLLTTSLSFPLIFRKCLLNSNPSPYIRNNIQKQCQKKKKKSLCHKTKHSSDKTNIYKYVQLQFPSGPLMKTKYPGRRNGCINNSDLISGSSLFLPHWAQKADTMASCLDLSHYFPQVLEVCKLKINYATILNPCQNIVARKTMFHL